MLAEFGRQHLGNHHIQSKPTAHTWEVAADCNTKACEFSSCPLCSAEQQENLIAVSHMLDAHLGGGGGLGGGG